MEEHPRFKLRRWVIVLGALAVVLVVALAVVLWVPGRSHRRERGPRVVEVPTVAPEPTSSVDSTTTTATTEPTVTAPVKPKAKAWSSSALAPFARSGELWVVREDGRGDPRKIGNLGETATYLISPNRRLLAYTRPRRGKKPLLVADLDSGETYEIADTTDAYQGFPYAWSPDSRRLAYTVPVYSGSLRTGERLYVTTADGSERTRIASSAGSPAWGFGDNIVFRRADFAHGTWRLYKVKASGGRASEVPSSGQATSYGWAPNRAHLAFAITEPAAQGGLSVVWLLKAGEKIPQPVLQEKLSHATYSRLVWSPLGSQIAVDAAGDDGYSRVTVIDVSSMNVSWQVNAQRDNYLLGWTRDGSRLLYFEGNVFQGAPSNMWTVKRDAKSARIIVTDAGVQ